MRCFPLVIRGRCRLEQPVREARAILALRKGGLASAAPLPQHGDRRRPHRRQELEEHLLRDPWEHRLVGSAAGSRMAPQPSARGGGRQPTGQRGSLFLRQTAVWVSVFRVLDTHTPPGVGFGYPHSPLPISETARRAVARASDFSLSGVRGALSGLGCGPIPR